MPHNSFELYMMEPDLSIRNCIFFDSFFYTTRTADAIRRIVLSPPNG